MALGWFYRLADEVRHRLRLRQWEASHAWGRRGEDLAHRFLARQGYEVVARNYVPGPGSGEIDLVAWDGGVLVFVEVKSRHSVEHGTPDRAVGAEKRLQIVRAARKYLRAARRFGEEDPPFRFDLVNIVWNDPPEVEHLKDAFFPRRGALSY